MIILKSIIAFASTNIDDLFVLMLFFANRQMRARNVVIGQFVGMVALILISIVASFVGLVVEQKYIGLLGLFPIYFGIKGLMGMLRKQPPDLRAKYEKTKFSGHGIVSVASVTIANGADNLGVYIPLFSVLLVPQKLIMTTTFLAMTALWCILAWYLSKYGMIGKMISKFGHIISPIVLLLLGLYILFISRTFELI